MDITALAIGIALTSAALWQPVKPLPAVSAHIAISVRTADAVPIGFRRLKNALQAAAGEVVPRQPRTATTPTRDLPSIHAGRSLSAMLNQPAQTMAALHQEEVLSL